MKKFLMRLYNFSQCPLCHPDYGTNRFDQMLSHAAVEHEGEPFEMACERCEVVMDIGRLEGHRKECRAGGRIPCDVCGRMQQGNHNGGRRCSSWL